MWDEDKLQQVGRTDPEDVLAAIDAIAAPLEDAPAVIDDAAEHCPAPSQSPNPARAALIAAKAAELKADAKANGRTAKRNREIDADRKANPEAHNADRRHKYALAKLETSGKLPRRYRKGVTPEQRKSDNAKAQQEQRNMLTPGSPELEAYNKAGAERAKASRDRERERKEVQAEVEQIALQSLRTFSLD